ncbi:Hsp70 family protein [Dactylosporangium vinaceum]|uniref:Hsp70 family protein n=1 Tax=Dactylosporangium vinaceum TaxID=53362 RepID=A0ABV5M208_9ACTN|nr:Hsp70 family protein [Dactylosporangium vinaceum]UAB99318.1 Hsp70 family protein [Dactylosporangium vinaceum]
MAIARYQLGIDFGSSTTVAVTRGPDGRVRPLLFDASPLLTSAVFAGPGGALLTGADAERAAIGHPAGLEASPKRCIDDSAVWLGDREYPVADLIAAVLGRVRTEARRVHGGEPERTVLTHPAGWGPARLAVLGDAAARAGLSAVAFVPEPVAAADYFAGVLGRAIPPGRALLVYDLGAGTFDATVLQAGADGYRIAGSAGLTDVGGLDLDAAVVAAARAHTAGASAEWERLDRPRAPADHQARYTLWRGARAVKEQLSRHPAADLHVPLADTDVRLVRDEFEAMAAPFLHRTVGCVHALLRDCRLTPADLEAVFLVGGSTRIPLAGTLLHRALGIAPTVLDQPELVVAEGSLHGLAPSPPSRTPLPPEPAPSPAPPVSVPAAPAAPPQRPRRRLLVAGGAAVLLAVAAAVVVYVNADASDGTGQPGALGGSSGPPRSSATVPSPAPPGGRALTGHTGVVSGVAFSPDSRTLATASNDHTVRLWDVAAPAQAQYTLAEHSDSVLAVAFNPKSATLATGSGDGTGRIWDLDRNQSTHTLSGHQVAVWSVAYSGDGKTLATGGNEGAVRLWNAADGRFLRAMTAHDGPVQALAFSPDGAVVASGGDDGKVRLWKAADGSPLTAADDGWSVSGLAFSPDGRYLATVDENGTFRLRDSTTAGQVRKLPPRQDVTAYAVAFSPDSKLLAMGTSEGQVTLYDVAAWQPLKTMPGPKESVRSVAFSPDGRFLAAGSVDNTAWLWSLR